MERSEVNVLIEDPKSLMHVHRITLPPFAYWSPEKWKSKGSEFDEIRPSADQQLKPNENRMELISI